MKVTNLRLFHEGNFRDGKTRSFKRGCKVPLNKTLESLKDFSQGFQEGWIIARRILKAQITRQNPTRQGIDNVSDLLDIYSAPAP